jgi:hypothetical protein
MTCHVDTKEHQLPRQINNKVVTSSETDQENYTKPNTKKSIQTNEHQGKQLKNKYDWRIIRKPNLTKHNPNN